MNKRELAEKYYYDNKPKDRSMSVKEVIEMIAGFVDYYDNQEIEELCCANCLLPGTCPDCYKIRL